MPMVHVNGQDIYYAARKLDRQPVLLLIHGAAGSHLDWPPQLRRFEPLGSCAIDLPGHGRSSGMARSSVSAYADDALAVIKALKLSEAILVGHSMGGAVALDIALKESGVVAALVLIATGARLKVNKALFDLVDSNFKSAVNHIAATAWGPNAEANSVHQGSQIMLSGDPTTMRNDFAACNDFDIMSQVADISVPTLVLVGTEDQMTPPKFGRYLADNIPHAEFIMVEGAGHMLATEQPKVVAEAIGDFVHRRLGKR